jgi:hypothetical protein
MVSGWLKHGDSEVEHLPLRPTVDAMQHIQICISRHAPLWSLVFETLRDERRHFSPPSISITKSGALSRVPRLLWVLGPELSANSRGRGGPSHA